MSIRASNRSALFWVELYAFLLRQAGAFRASAGHFAKLFLPSIIVIGLSSAYAVAVCFYLDDVALLQEFVWIVGAVARLVLEITIVALPVAYFANMVLYVKPESPLKYTGAQLRALTGKREEIFHFLFVVLAFAVFAAAFSINKDSIFAINGFKWDHTFYEMDRAIGLGRLPHVYSQWIFDNPVSAIAIEAVYQSWFFLIYLSVLLVGFRVVDTKTAQVYLLSFVLAWFVGGNILAKIFSSAGPIFVEIHGIQIYQDHLTKMQEAFPYFGSFANSTRELLLEAHQQSELTSISAFPSMHVTSTMLLVLLSRRLGRKAFAASVIFFALLFVGSFSLLWHYLVDSLAGVVLALAAWAIASWIYSDKRDVPRQ